MKSLEAVCFVMINQKIEKRLLREESGENMRHNRANEPHLDEVDAS